MEKNFSPNQKDLAEGLYKEALDEIRTIQNLKIKKELIRKILEKTFPPHLQDVGQKLKEAVSQIK